MFRANNANANAANANANAGNANNINSRGRDPYPINRGRDDAVPDGPTERIDDRPQHRRDRIAWLGVLVAVFSLTTSAVAVLAAWRALTLAERAPAAAAAAAQVRPAVTDFAVSYAQEPLRVQVGCSAVLFVDLDEPRANAVEKVSDLRYDSRCGTEPPRLTLGPGAVAGAQVKDADTDAAGCAKAIRTSPLGPGASAEVKKGAVLCVLTGGTPAAMALVEVTDVGQTGTAGMRATSWKVTA
ncbi:hypothetical protein Ari01nite_01210 [Paractinoplanes rishiriensis]|uniref:Uncharacterized protein n=1 Tax=Paractinoplanes rishiriensis TaxID=1050105 RepID=A0A919JP99_9ACTN|nr:hypothetical protein Ari01nite_01210 [Actinoplanes rishiriensis]